MRALVRCCARLLWNQHLAAHHSCEKSQKCSQSSWNDLMVFEVNQQKKKIWAALTGALESCSEPEFTFSKGSKRQNLKGPEHLG